MERGPDPNFYIFLCFGQSNMEGQGPIEEEDKEVDERFQMMAPIDFPMLGREKGKWYKAVPPLCREDTKLSLVDYFGRYLTDILPKDIKIGIINVSVGGCKIEMYDENKVENYLKTAPGWLKENALKYENNPFRVLMNRAKEAQKVGIIKGILMHQGEANKINQEWYNNVKNIYNNILKELNLQEENIPLLVGEVVQSEYSKKTGKKNEMMKLLKNHIKNCYIISSEGLLPQSDFLHFTSESYRIFGKRYGEQMLRILLENK